MSSKKLLLIEPFTALPQSSGGRSRIFHTIDELKKYFDLTVWSFFANQEELSLEENWLQKINVPYQHFITQKKQFFSFLTTGQPYWFANWRSKDLSETLQRQGAEYQTIQVEFSQLLYLAKYLPKNSSKVFVAHDIASLSFWRRLQTEKSLIKKTLHFLRFIEVYFYERKYLPIFDLVIAMSETDKSKLMTFFHLKNVVVVENGIDKINFLPTSKRDGFINLGLIGSFSHPPNLEAFRFCCEKILPLLEKNNIAFKFYLAGANGNELVRTITGKFLKDPKQVINLGFIKEIKDFYQQIDFLITPLFAGSGTRIKILESLSFGRPVITTEIGAEGISISDPWIRRIDQSKEKDAQLWLATIKQLMDREFDQKHYFYLNAELQKLTWAKIMKTHAHVL